MDQKVRKGIAIFFFGIVLSAHALATSPEPDPSCVLPTRTVQGYLMIVSATVNGAGPYNFLVDTGTNTTLIDPQLASELALKPMEKVPLASLGDSVSTVRHIVALRVGPAAVSEMEALAVPLPQLQTLDSSVRGVLGMNFLLQFSFELDYEHQRFVIFPDPRTAVVPHGLRARAEINQLRLLVPVASKSAPRGTWKLALDSGISQPLVFGARIKMPEADANFCSSSSCRMQVSTNLGDHAASAFAVHDLSIAGEPLDDASVVVLRNDQLNVSDPQDGLLAASLFGSVFFDRSTASLIFSPRLPRQLVAGGTVPVTHQDQR